MQHADFFFYLYLIILSEYAKTLLGEVVKKVEELG